MSILYTEECIPNIKLIDDSKYSLNRKKWWNVLIKFMSKQLYANIEFGEKLENIDGYFRTDIVRYDSICVPEDSADCTIEKDSAGNIIGGSIKFKSDDDFATFIHEASHYMHFIKDNGRFTAPHLIDHEPARYSVEKGFKENSDIIDLEYEAGYRALITARFYEMFSIKDRTVLENNLINMSNYLTILNRKDFPDLNKRKKQLKKWVKHCPNFTSINNYEITI